VETGRARSRFRREIASQQRFSQKKKGRATGMTSLNEQRSFAKGEDGWAWESRDKRKAIARREVAHHISIGGRNMQIEGLSAIVTGGASGLGGATAQLLAERGASVMIFDLNEEAGHAHAEVIGARFFKVDVADEVNIAVGIAEAERCHGVARILVNCAGIALGLKTVARDAVPHPLDAFRKTLEINLIGSFGMAAQFAARLSLIEPVGEERGVIIHTASVAAYEGQIGQAAYAASKGGVAAMTLPMARDLAPHAIRVMTIAPGLFWTPMLAALPQAAQDSLGSQVPFPSRLGRPSEYAQLVESIVLNPMLNGETIRLDGAIRMAPR
jgi:NAD(P)-dependent dehydrogenase (short-subunit alcohol dehydrogenase family)